MLEKLKKAAATLLIAAAAAVSFHGAAQATELDDILARGKLRVGISAFVLPYSQQDTSGEWTGYDPAVAKLIADALGVELEIVPIDPPSRVPFLVTDKVDLAVSILGVTPERLRQVAFSHPYSQIEVAIVAAKDIKLETAEDLKPLRIAVVRAASHAQLVEKIAPVGSTILSFEDDFAQVQAIANGQADAIASSPDVIDRIRRVRPDYDGEVKLLLHRQLNAIGVKRENTDLLRFVNSILVYNTVSTNALPALQTKYFGKPFENLPQF